MRSQILKYASPNLSESVRASSPRLSSSSCDTRCRPSRRLKWRASPRVGWHCPMQKRSRCFARSFEVATTSSLAGGRTQRPVRRATLLRAATNGFAAFVRSHGSSAAAEVLRARGGTRDRTGILCRTHCIAPQIRGSAATVL
jgi:hypothetical protein